MKWAVSTFKQWIVSRNQRSTVGETIDVDILSKPVDKDSKCTELCHILCLFVVEAIQEVARYHGYAFSPTGRCLGRGQTSKGYIYMENGSGGVAQMKIENKVVPSYTSANAEDKE